MAHTITCCFGRANKFSFALIDERHTDIAVGSFSGREGPCPCRPCLGGWCGCKISRQYRNFGDVFVFRVAVHPQPAKKAALSSHTWEFPLRLTWYLAMISMERMAWQQAVATGSGSKYQVLYASMRPGCIVPGTPRNTRAHFFHWPCCSAWLQASPFIGKEWKGQAPATPFDETEAGNLGLGFASPDRKVAPWKPTAVICSGLVGDLPLCRGSRSKMVPWFHCCQFWSRQLRHLPRLAHRALQ